MAANNDCEATAPDASNFRTNGCAFSGDDCPIKGKKVNDELDMRFFAEQKMDSNKRWKDEMIHFVNPASGVSNEGGEGNSKSLQDRQVVHDGHAAAEDFITQNPKAAKSDRAENCTEYGGRITGIGPSCDVGERGEGDLHNCVFTKIADCEARRQDCRSNVSYENMGTIISANVNSAQPPVEVSPNCDDYYKSCVEKTTKLCVCSDCEYESCLYDCDDGDTDDVDPDDDGTDPTTDTDYNGGPKLGSVNFTNSAYDIPIPIIYGRYVISGNIIWASNPTVTTVTERTESVDEKRIRVQIDEKFIYHGSFAVGLCEGPISGLVRVWLGETLIFSRTLSVDETGNVEPTEGVLVDEIENMLLFSSGSDDQEYYDQTRMRVTLYPGSEEQLPPAGMGTNQPGYRGLAFLLFENVNLSYLGGNVPQLRVEISEFTRTESFPRIVASLSDTDVAGARSDLLVADVRTNSIYVAADPAPGRFDVTRGFRKLRYDTLDEISYYYDGDADIDPSTFFTFPNGIVGYQSDNGNLQRATYFIRPETNTVLDVYGYDADATPGEGAVHLDDTLGALSPATSSTLAYESTSYGFDERLYSVDLAFAITTDLSYKTVTFDEASSAAVPSETYINNNDPGSGCYDPCAEECAALHCVDGGGELEGEEGGGGSLECDEPAYSDCLNACDAECFGGALNSYAPFASILTSEYFLPDETIEVYKRKQFIDIFALQGSSQSELRVYRMKYGDTTSTGGVTQSLEEIIEVPASAWGGQSSGVSGLFVIDDRARRQAVVFLADGAGGAHVVALETEAYVGVNWYAYVPDFLAHTSPGPRMLAYPADDYVFIDATGTVAQINLSSGELSYGANILPLGLPGVGGAQVYDPARNAITYISDDDRVVRVYPSRTMPALVPVAHIIADIAARVGIDPDYIDVSDIEDITIVGTAVFENTAPAAVIDQLIKMFALSVVEQDGKIYFKRTGVGDEHTIDEMEMLTGTNGETYSRVEVDSYVEPKRLTLAYADIDNFCRPAYQMANQPITPTYSVNSISHIRVEVAAALDGADAAKIAESIYARLHSRINTIEFETMAVYSVWSPNDFVTITFNDTTARRYRITNIYSDPSRGRLRITAEDDVSFLSSEDMSIVPWEDPAKYRVQQAFRKLQAQTIRMFTATPFTDADMLASTTHHVFYVGIQSELSEADFPPTGVSYKPLNGGEVVHETGPQITKPLQLGRAVTLLPPDGGEFDTDMTTEFVVRFARADVVNYLTNATKSQLLNDRTRNCLLVGREWIQFQNVTYDPLTKEATFSGLFRGRNGTDTYVFRHNIGEEVVLPVVGAFKPIYVHYQRLRVSESLSIRLQSLQTVQVSGKPTVFATNSDSIRPWAPADPRRYTSAAVPANIVVTFAYRGKHDDDDLVDGADVPTFEPTPETYGENREVSGGSYSRRYAVYFSRVDADYSVVEEMIRAREENLQGVFSGYIRVEANNDAEATLTAAQQTTLGFNPAIHTLYVHIVQIGGPANNKAGFVSKASFPPGTYGTLPLGPRMRVRASKVYVVLSPDNLKLYSGGAMLVLRP